MLIFVIVIASVLNGFLYCWS